MAKAKAAPVEEKKIAVIEPENKGLTTDYDYGDDAGSGFENQTSADMSIPFLGVLQGLSPGVMKAPEDGGIEGAKVGMIFNTVTQELYDGNEGVVFVCATTQHKYVEYTPRSQGGGFKGVHEIDSKVVVGAKERAKGAFGKYTTTEGNDLIETFYIYGVVLNEDRSVSFPVVIGMSSTKIKAYKSLMAKLRTFQVKVGERRITPPLFAHCIRMTTFADRTPKGPFSNIRFSPAFDDAAGVPSMNASLLQNNSEALKAAITFKDSVNGGKVAAAYASEAGEREAGADAQEHF